MTPARAPRYAGPSMRWPNGAKCALCLTFDFDAETLWLSRDHRNAERPAAMSFGTFGATVGLPRLLDFLADEGLPASFFVPGWTAERHTAKVEAILADGHEVAHHGYLHLWPSLDRPDEVEEEVMQGFAALERTVGVRPVGYRAPAGETTRHLYAVLEREGIRYDSSLKGDIAPYRQDPEAVGASLVELPTDPAIDDASYGMSSALSPRPLFGRDHVLSIWCDSFREMHALGGLFVPILHPQVSGRPLRLAILRDFIAYTRTFEGVWYATGQEIAAAFVAQEGER